MKTRFNTYDIVCSVTELQRLIGMRVNNIYDIDSKTYLIRLQKTDEKCVLLLESGNRFHSTAFEWPKNVAPSGFSMKMRKHLKNKRLEKLSQLGTDRIVDMQFGENEAAYHVILELYDRGNILLTDHELKILYILRPHIEGEEVRFAVREKYPVDRARTLALPEQHDILKLLQSANTGDALRKLLLSHLDYGPALLEHVLLQQGFSLSSKIGKQIQVCRDIEKIMLALVDAEEIMKSARNVSSKGFIIQRREERAATADDKEYYFSNQEFHPMLYKQHSNLPYKEFDSFDTAADEFFSMLESQKIDMKVIQQEREAMKKLDNVKKNLEDRVQALEQTQIDDKKRAELITRNQEVVDRAILAIQSALACQMSWPDIELLVKEAQSKGDPIAKYIKQLKLEINHITLLLSDPYESDNSDENDEEKLKPMLVDIDLALTAFANATKFYDQKRSAAKKQQKTIESQSKAFKSAEKKTKQALKEVQTISNINKARKMYWFEKFFWFISSENYLVIGGRDQQQNELLVKRYMNSNDVYVHADVHGASSVVIKNPTGQPLPPKTLNEAGTMAICYSVAWQAKVVTSAWWVNASQVSKTAPTGEYLTTGSFMIRGKKNYLPPCHLIMGFSFLFKLEDGSVARHKDERKVRAPDEASEMTEEDSRDDIELDVPDDDSDEEKDDNSGQIETEIATLEQIKHSNDSDDEEEEYHFPDTHIKIQHFEGTRINLVAEPATSLIEDEEPESDKVVFLGDDKPVLLKCSGRSRASSDSKIKAHKHEQEVEEASKKKDTKQHTQIKRGQKGKLKKIKEKYKDQDEEERELRMAILQSAGKAKDNKKSKKNTKDHTNEAKANKKNQVRVREQPVAQHDVDDDEETQVSVDVDMLDSFTGLPCVEDELLFAVPVVAPYNTLTNYKLKVKLTPGTARRGKAARTAVSMFLRDRATTARERDLLRSVKDESLARNIPGSVKLSAPNLQAMKK